METRWGGSYKSLAQIQITLFKIMKWGHKLALTETALSEGPSVTDASSILLLQLVQVEPVIR